MQASAVKASFGSFVQPSEAASSGELLRLNVGGRSFWMPTSAIMLNAPGSRLGSLALTSQLRRQQCDCWIEQSQVRLSTDSRAEHIQEYLFCRSAQYFDAIYDFVMTGKMHRPVGCCLERFAEELEYWRVCPVMPQCCQFLDDCDDEPDTPVDEFQGLPLADARRAIWNTTEGVQPSLPWKVFVVTSNFVVIVSILCLVLGSMPEFQVAGACGSGGDQTGGEDDGVHPALSVVEVFCSVYFTAEYATRLLVAPAKETFVRDPLNVIDLLAVVPFLLELLLSTLGLDKEHVERVRWLFLAMRVLRVMRVMRVAKLGRHSQGMRTMALVVKRSRSQLKMVLAVLVAGLLAFSTVIYFCEKEQQGTPFTSIPAASWWCIVTMSTVGYGDVVPTTTAGKLVASLAIVCGVLVLALPITIIVNNFMQVAKLNR